MCSRVSKATWLTHMAQVSVCARPSSVRVRPSGYLRRSAASEAFFSFSVLTLFALGDSYLSSELLDVVCGESCYSETLCESPCCGLQAAMVLVWATVGVTFVLSFLSSLLFPSSHVQVPLRWWTTKSFLLLEMAVCECQTGSRPPPLVVMIV